MIKNYQESLVLGNNLSLTNSQGYDKKQKKNDKLSPNQ